MCWNWGFVIVYCGFAVFPMFAVYLSFFFGGGGGQLLGDMWEGVAAEVKGWGSHRLGSVEEETGKSAYICHKIMQNIPYKKLPKYCKSL